jgi:hypothetical protein
MNSTPFVSRMLTGRCRAMLSLLLLALQILVAPGGAATGNSELERLEAAHAKEVSDKIDAPFLAGLQRLNDSYRLTLDNAMKKAVAQGELDDTVACQTELKRFAAENNVPDQDAPGLNAGVAKLRAAWRAEAARLTKARAAGLQPLAAAHLANLRTLEKELTRAVKIDDALAVRARISALSAQAAAAPVEATTPATATPPIAPPSAPATPKPGLTVATFARPADKADLYACCDNGVSIYLNNKEILPKVGRDSASKVRIAIKEGDVIAARSGDRFDLNSFWIACYAPTGEFLFETSLAWKSFLPAATDKWWDTRKTKDVQPVEEAPDSQEYVSLVKAGAALTPAYMGSQPIRSTLKDETARLNYVMYTVAKGDLLPKKIDPSLIVNLTALSGPLLGKTVRIATAKAGPECIVLGETDPEIATYDRAKAPAGQFKVGRGTQMGTIVFESVATPGLYLRHENYRLRVLKGIAAGSCFYVQKALAGPEGYSLSAQTHPHCVLAVNDRNRVDLVETRKLRDPGKAVFFLEPAPAK